MREKNSDEAVEAPPKRSSRSDFHGSVSRGGGAIPKPPCLGLLFPDLADPREPIAIFGQYPKSLIGDVLPWLKCERAEIVHVCSGSLRPGEGLRIDIRADAFPDIVADARALPLPSESRRAVMIDPPYTRDYAKSLYGVEYPTPRDLLREATRILIPGGRVAFVHYVVPMPPLGSTFIKSWGLSTGFGFPMRAVTIFEKNGETLFPKGNE